MLLPTLAATLVLPATKALAATIVFTGNILINSDRAVATTFYRRRAAAITSTGDVSRLQRRLLSLLILFFPVVITITTNISNVQSYKNLTNSIKTPNPMCIQPQRNSHQDQDQVNNLKRFSQGVQSTFQVFKDLDFIRQQ